MLSDNSDPELSSSDECDEPNEPKSKKKSGANKIVRRNKDNSTNKNNFSYSTILDSGTEWTVIGGPAWLPVKIYSKSMTMSAIDGGMDTVEMRLCDAVTAVRSQKGETKLIGVKRSGYSQDINDNEAIINMHLLREAGWNVDCVAKRHGGTQQIILNKDDKIPLEYEPNSYKLFVQCRHPTPEEIRNMTINWVDCHIEDLKIEKGQLPIRRGKDAKTIKQPMAVSENVENELVDKVEANENSVKEKVDIATNITEPLVDSPMPESDHRDDEDELIIPPANKASINWLKTLGFCTEETLRKTLQNTTRYYPNYTEAEVREYPKQHRMQRLHALHLRQTL